MEETNLTPGSIPPLREAERIGPRSAGILLHATALQGPGPIGTLGAGARRFVDFLEDLDQRWWQVLPMNPPGYGGSPYQSYSLFAGNELLLDAEDAVDTGFLPSSEAPRAPTSQSDRVDFSAAADASRQLVSAAWRAGGSDSAYHAWREQNRSWLRPYAAFMVLHRRYDGRPWQDWPAPFSVDPAAAIARVEADEGEAADRVEFGQYLFDYQWSRLREYARARGVLMFGDAPIFAALNSAEVWRSRRWFQLQESGEPTAVAGVPPDYFSREGQRWGNPVYDWDALAEDGFSFWVERLRLLLDRHDAVRIDHFRGFSAYWRIPANAPTAREGEWRSAPGVELFTRVEEEMPGRAIVAEDLGDIDDDVRALRDRFGYPGMKVLQFGLTDRSSEHNPQNFESDRFVAYTGTHDNDTLLGWLAGLPRNQREMVREWTGGSGRSLEGLAWKIVQELYRSTARVAILPMQDILLRGSDARFNTPGTSRASNWTWRLEQGDLDRVDRDRIRALVAIHNRSRGSKT